MPLWIALSLSLLLAVPAEPQEKTPYPPLPPAKDDPSFGAQVQRTMGLLAGSTPAKRNRVRILFYGQSITEQKWSKLVAEDLRRRFPHADLEIENKAIGGFASQLLSRVAEHDLLPFYPDLVIFHVYGDHTKYEEILRLLRTRTTAEILMQRDHVTKWPVENPDQKHPLWWDHMMNDVFLPQLAKKYGCGLADVRGQWLDYLKAHSLEPKALLSDDVHLNDHGCFVMAEIVKRYLVHKPELLSGEARSLVRSVEPGKEVAWQGTSLKLEFEGNRVDLVAAASGSSGTARILIDGKKPSEFPDCIAFTRTSPSQSFWGPALLRVSSEKPREVESWTLKILEADDAAEHLKFRVSGSKSGPDGEGVSDARFVSTSGRVVLEPGDWWVKNIRQITKKPVPAGFEITWKAVPMFADTFTPPKSDDPSRETVVTVAQGLPNGKHTLELLGQAPVGTIRIYRPPMK
ncbi:MAG TPA: SGNH/GDSL hydrolase family protein [Planctomycetota bacterium]|nr:SGNH/GDSL hydrolase family protein [Planctomycetota bacterium]